MYVFIPAAGEVAQKQTLAVGPALCGQVKAQLEEMGETLAPPEAAAAAGEAGAQQQGAAEPAEEDQQAEEEQPDKKPKKGAAAAAPAAAEREQAAEQQQRQQGVGQSAEDLEGDFAGVPLLGVSYRERADWCGWVSRACCCSGLQPGPAIRLQLAL